MSLKNLKNGVGTGFLVATSLFGTGCSTMGYERFPQTHLIQKENNSYLPQDTNKEMSYVTPISHAPTINTTTKETPPDFSNLFNILGTATLLSSLAFASYKFSSNEKIKEFSSLSKKNVKDFCSNKIFTEKNKEIAKTALIYTTKGTGYTLKQFVKGTCFVLQNAGILTYKLTKETYKAIELANKEHKERLERRRTDYLKRKHEIDNELALALNRINNLEFIVNRQESESINQLKNRLNSIESLIYKTVGEMKQEGNDENLEEKINYIKNSKNSKLEEEKNSFKNLKNQLSDYKNSLKNLNPLKFNTLESYLENLEIKTTHFENDFENKLNKTRKKLSNYLNRKWLNPNKVEKGLNEEKSIFIANKEREEKRREEIKLEEMKREKEGRERGERKRRIDVEKRRREKSFSEISPSTKSKKRMSNYSFNVSTEKKSYNILNNLSNETDEKINPLINYGSLFDKEKKETTHSHKEEQNTLEGISVKSINIRVGQRKFMDKFKPPRKPGDPITLDELEQIMDEKILGMTGCPNFGMTPTEEKLFNEKLQHEQSMRPRMADGIAGTLDEEAREIYYSSLGGGIDLDKKIDLGGGTCGVMNQRP